MDCQSLGRHRFHLFPASMSEFPKPGKTSVPTHSIAGLRAGESRERYNPLPEFLMLRSRVLVAEFARIQALCRSRKG